MTEPFALELRNIGKSYGNKTALRSVSVSVHKGEVLCILGPSGSGKSTLLKIIAGLEKPSSGNVSINGQPQENIQPQRRDVGFVFQSTEAVFPHKNVFDNVAFPLRLKIRRKPKRQIIDQVSELLRLVRLTSFKKQYPEKLSGGERQRVAIARALVYRPSLLLLDEPLSSLDNILKRELVDIILDIRSAFNPTILYVTHDEREALDLADRIAVLNDGEILQCDTPVTITNNPSSSKVAEIIGGWNILRASCTRTNSHCHIRADQLDFTVDLQNIRSADELTLGIPVSSIELNDGASKEGFVTFPANVERVIPRGNEFLVYLRCGQTSLRYETRVDLTQQRKGVSLNLKVQKSAIRIWQ